MFQSVFPWLFCTAASVAEPHWFQCGSGSSILDQHFRIQGYDDKKLGKIYSWIKMYLLSLSSLLVAGQALSMLADGRVNNSERRILFFEKMNLDFLNYAFIVEKLSNFYQFVSSILFHTIFRTPELPDPE
jgi:hypothetical protein